MVTTHVFIVDLNTFKYHLEYMFAGTGSKDDKIDFNHSSDSTLPTTTENNLVGMIADASRIRKGDNIVFYLQQNKEKGIAEGKFYGLFEAKRDWSFLDNNDELQYLTQELGKSLTFRTFVAPKEVYPKGVTEWEALDSIDHVQRPHQMLWSLIYRKLRGNRGNTMITEYEASKLIGMIRQKNNSLPIRSNSFTFDAKKEEIESFDHSHEYLGRVEEIDIFPRLKSKYEKRLVFEAHLQAFITKNIGKGSNLTLDNVILDKLQIEWMGNEVYCGVGMQRIDFMAKLSGGGDSKTIVAVELKAVNAREDAVTQIERYMEWLRQYYIPNLGSQSINIRPVIVGRKYDRNKQPRLDLLSRIRTHILSGISIEYVEYSISDDKLEFERVEIG